MRKIILKKRFKKDFEKIKRTGRDMTRLAEVIDLLEERKPLPPTSRDHQLTGNLKEYRECHLGGDWLLIYLLSADSVTFTRTGSHSELLD